jgi:hypothetical protein
MVAAISSRLSDTRRYGRTHICAHAGVHTRESVVSTFSLYRARVRVATCTTSSASRLQKTSMGSVCA